LITEPVRPLNGVVHVPLPAVLTQIAKASRNTSLSGNGVAAGRKDLGDARCLQTGLDSALYGAQSGTTGTNDYRIIGVIDNLVRP
jgi:hypothetical protein